MTPDTLPVPRNLVVAAMYYARLEAEAQRRLQPGVLPVAAQVEHALARVLAAAPAPIRPRTTRAEWDDDARRDAADAGEYDGARDWAATEVRP